MAADDDGGALSPPSYKNYALSGKIMLGAIIALLFVVILMICLHLYVRLHLLPSTRRRAPHRRSRRPHFVFTPEPRPAAATLRGLPPSVLKSLPVFVHSSKPEPDPVYCAVCLSEFEDKEIGRVIPKCNHSFHVGCIDMWFYSHVTCPLCRSEVKPGPENPPDSVRDPGPSSGPVELVVAPAEGSVSDEDMSVNFVKSLSFKRVLCREKRDGVSPSGNAVTETAERDLEKAEAAAAASGVS